jgi:uncharacterized protein
VKEKEGVYDGFKYDRLTRGESKVRNTRRIRFATTLIWLVIAGCAKMPASIGTTWHEKCGWKAEDYFDDPQVIALCHAIQANDLKEMDRLIAAGVDVNAKGKGNMTPLLWAYPDNKLERFSLLLKHGADPDIKIQSDFNTRGGMRSGDSVTYMACKSAFPGYFDAVFSHGGVTSIKFLYQVL